MDIKTPPISFLPESGLIIRQPWIEMVLSELKPWEMRSSKTTKRGRICLIEQGTSSIVGEANLVNCLKPQKRFIEDDYWYWKHRINDKSLMKKWNTPWILREVKRYDEPIIFNQPPGAVIWVDVHKAIFG